ncbi:MAG: translation initiation factor IF-2 subunit beta [Candidatus Aenigmarchaeota archaeon]|nr:translation initiation factor IF-2 subunit beta [Candidatus Aenigmarchaeota archaeon]
MADEYDALLKVAMQQMPKKDLEKKRFTVPQAVAFVQGNKTIIKNFIDITSALRREPHHLAKHLLKQLATPGNVDAGTLVLQRKVEQSMIQRKLEDYIREYVYCHVCGEPDTSIVKEGRFSFMKCEACGARSSSKEM